MPLKAVISNIGKKLGRVYLILDLPKRLCRYKGSSLFAQWTVMKTESLTTLIPGVNVITFLSVTFRQREVACLKYSTCLKDFAWTKALAYLPSGQ
jgi:hypothetical protein